VILQLGADSLFYRHGDTRLFVCHQDGQPVGRIVASVDHDFPHQEVGHFGYFEACPEKACTEKLIQASEEWLREKGKKRIEGPINLNILAGYRLQTTGFDTPAFPGEPRNPEYYSNLLGSLGYREVALAIVSRRFERTASRKRFARSIISSTRSSLTTTGSARSIWQSTRRCKAE
jgi:hypothetical protein